MKTHILQMELVTAQKRLDEVMLDLASALDLRELEEKISRINELLLEMIEAQEDGIALRD